MPFCIHAHRFEKLTLASAAGFTFPFTAKAPPRRTICPMFLENPGSSSIACNQ